MYHIFFSIPSVDGHLSWFSVSTVLNSASVNNGVHVSFQIIVFSRYMLRHGIAESYGSSVISFTRNLHTVSTVAVPIYISSNSVGGFPFLRTHWSFIVCRLFDDGLSSSVTLHLTVDLIEHLFMCLLAVYMSSLKKCLFGSFAHFWTRLWLLVFLFFFVFFFLILSCMSCLYIWTLIPSWSLHLQIFSSILRVVCREPARDIPLVTKVMRKEARHTQRRDRASGVPPDILKHLPPKKPESAYFIALCSHLWLY